MKMTSKWFCVVAGVTMCACAARGADVVENVVAVWIGRY
jgi:hypothetical protein